MESKNNLRTNPYFELGMPFVSMLLFIGAALAGIHDGLVYSALWIFLSALSFVSLYFAFPHSWKYGIWLLASYFCAFVGVAFFILKRNEGLQFSIIGLVFILGSVSFGWSLVQEIRFLRDVVKENTSGKKYVPIGNWFILVVLFVIFSNLSIYSWTNWVDPSKGWSILPYLFFEVTISILAVVILWFPELAIDWDILHEESPTFAAIKRELKAAESVVTYVKRQKKIKVTAEKFTTCPVCNAKLSMHVRKCPSCGNEEYVGWCAKHETFVVTCVSCGKPTLYGLRECKACNSPMAPRLVCIKCKNEASIKAWTRVEPKSRIKS